MRFADIKWRIKRSAISLLYELRSWFKGEDDEKIFCLSYQRTGTTSVGEFFKLHGYKVMGWHMSHKLRWSELWYEGRMDKVYRSYEFRANTVFEDSPWFHEDLYKELEQRFPKARFVLFERDSDKWFNSMMSHSGGMNLGSVYIHTKLYDRENELDGIEGLNPDIRSITNFNLLPLNESHRKHYIDIYEKRNNAVKEHFKDTDKLIALQLEDPEKWVKLARFFRIDVDHALEVHANKTK